MADASALMDLSSDRGAVLGANSPLYPPADYWTRRVEQSGPHHEIFVAQLPTRQIVGSTELLIDISNASRRHVGLLGICVHRDFRDKGIGKIMLNDLINYAERWQQVRRLELIVWEDNRVAQALYKQFGFVVEGAMRAYGLRDGRYDTALMMARLLESAPAIM